MENLNYSYTLILALVLMFPLSSRSQEKQQTLIQVRLDTSTSFQTIHNFGASDAWSCQHVGNWPDEKKNAIADLLFSMDTKTDGSPVGIGLSCWRFNIGAGSADQNTETNIGDPWRRAECFLQKDGSYNWEKQSGQRWFMQAAQIRGVSSFIGFVNSPPVWLTKNGRANSNRGNSVNLKKENMEKFSDFLVRVTQHLKEKEGIQLHYLSPVNEPQWDWEGGQEGSPWKNSEIASFCRILDRDIGKAGLKTKISITDAGKITHLFDRGNDSKRGFQMEQFFSPDSKNYLGNLDHMAKKISGHSYFTVHDDSSMNMIRTKLNDERLRIDPSLEFWMSEYCILAGNETLTGGGRDLGMNTALFVSNLIHADLTIANSSAWQWWLAVSPYNFKDGLVYIDKGEKDGGIYESKLLWAMGNYSRFIRPGAKRILAEYEEDGVCKVSAFKNKDEKVVLVVVNNALGKIRLKLPHLNNEKADKYLWYETSEENSLRCLGSRDAEHMLELKPRSVNTFVSVDQIN